MDEEVIGSKSCHWHQDVGKFSQSVLQSTVLATRCCVESASVVTNEISSNHNEVLGRVVSAQSDKILHLISEVMKHQNIKRNLQLLDLEEKVDLLSDANDFILEKVGLALDEATGQKRKEPNMSLASVNVRQLIGTSWNRNTSADRTPTNYNLLTAKNILRPQLKFADKIDNSSQPFEPSIKEKPNSLKPLAIVLEPTENGLQFSHPYHCELDHLQPHPGQLNVAIIKMPRSMEETSFKYIDKLDQLEALLKTLQHEEEFAIDLEHHSYRSFQGITCLMQISTRKADYIIDTLELRSHLQMLNEVFTHPKTVKVVHGADRDVEWLQRDFGLYLVNMFDTGQASRVLNMPSFSLAFLLKRYCNVIADKQYQLADWRIRPLPTEMIRYAREDTHYLLYIYDQLKNELIAKGNAQKNLLMSVLERSKRICAKRYIKPVFHEESHLELYQKSKKVFNVRQMFALKGLSKWRDSIARNADESTGYVLPNHMLLQIAELLPREQQGIFACCNPIPPLLRQQIHEIYSIILAARERPLANIESQSLQLSLAMTQLKVDLDNPLSSPHDWSHSMGEDGGRMEEDNVLPVSGGVIVMACEQPSLPLLCQQVMSKLNPRYQKIKDSIEANATPYHRYLTMKSELTSNTGEKEPMEKASIQNKASDKNLVSTSVKEHDEEKQQDDEDQEEEDDVVVSTIQTTNKKKSRTLKKREALVKKYSAQGEFQSFDYNRVDFKKRKDVAKKGKRAVLDESDDGDAHRLKDCKRPRIRKKIPGKSTTYTNTQRHRR